MRKLAALADRTAVLFLGVAAGAAIGFAFGRSGEKAPERPLVKPVRAVAAAPPAGPTDARGFECALPFQQHLLDTVAAGRAVTVGVFGDSFGDGVWSALYRLLPASEHYRVLKYSQQSTGFTRYSSLNLEDHAQAQLAADGPVDVAVISFGANDTQGVYSGGHAAALMSPEWQRVIGERVDRFVALMRAKGAMVYWVGLPKMRKASFDDDISAMNGFYTEKMKALRVPFIDIKPLTVDDAGEFTLYLPDPVSHERRLLRANDGVHMSMNGYVVITRALADRIKAYVGAAKLMAGVGEAPPPPAKAVQVTAEPKTAQADQPKRHGESRKRDDGEHKDKSGRPHRETGDADESRPAKRDDADKPPRREGGTKDRPAPSETRDGDAKDRAPKPDGAARHRSSETKPAEEKSGEARSSASRSAEPRPAAGETRRPAPRDEARPASGEGKRSDTHDKPGEAKPRAAEGKPRTSDAKKPRAEGKAKTDDAPAKPRKHRDEAPAGEGNSQ